MYKLIAPISLVIRNVYLLNPFERVKNGLIINLMIEPLLQVITYGIVGLFYERGSALWLGSFLYFIFYVLYIGLLMVFSLFSFSKLAIITVIVVYLSLLIIIIRNKINLFRLN